MSLSVVESLAPQSPTISRKPGAGKVILCERNTIGSGTSSMSGAMCGQQSEMTDTIAKLAVRARDIYDNFSDVVAAIAVSLNMAS